MNLPRLIGVVVSSRLATLYELETVYGAEDLHLFLEVVAVDASNRNVGAKEEY